MAVLPTTPTLEAPQGFPGASTPVVDVNTGWVSISWLHFFLALWQRTGSSSGNVAAATFNYPTVSGNTGQVLTSQGAGAASIWTTIASKLSQLTNDVGYLTTANLTQYSTTSSTQATINSTITSREATTIPLPISTTGAVGSSASLARADHIHPRETAPTYTGKVTAGTLAVGATTWTSGSIVPTAAQPNGSIYTRSTGTTGNRLYVSNGVAWTAVVGV